MENHIGKNAMNSDDFELVSFQLHKTNSQLIKQSKPDSKGELAMGCKFEIAIPRSGEGQKKFDLVLNMELTIDCIEEETMEKICRVETQHHAVFKVREGCTPDITDKRLSAEIAKFVYPLARDHVTDLLIKMGFSDVNLPWHVSLLPS